MGVSGANKQSLSRNPASEARCNPLTQFVPDIEQIHANERRNGIAASQEQNVRLERIRDTFERMVPSGVPRKR
jgi:hypothetical protein